MSRAMTNAIEIRPVTVSIGAEIVGLDLSEELSDEKIKAIEDALIKHLVLFFHDQNLTAEQQKKFGARFGKFNIHPVLKSIEGHPEIIELENDRERRPNINRWHTDQSSTEVPPKARILYAIDVPAVGGDTIWMNAYLAYEALSTPMRKFLDGLTATHRAPDQYYKDGLAKMGHKQVEGVENRFIPVHHPVVRTHPVTGRKALFVNELFTGHIDDISPAENRALLPFLFTHVMSPDFACRLKWRKGTVAFWDERCTQHFATADYWPEHRLMRQLTLAGDKPV